MRRRNLQSEDQMKGQVRALKKALSYNHTQLDKKTEIIYDQNKVIIKQRRTEKTLLKLSQLLAKIARNAINFSHYLLQLWMGREIKFNLDLFSRADMQAFPLLDRRNYAASLRTRSAQYQKKTHPVSNLLESDAEEIGKLRCQIYLLKTALLQSQRQLNLADRTIQKQRNTITREAPVIAHLQRLCIFSAKEIEDAYVFISYLKRQLKGRGLVFLDIPKQEMQPTAAVVSIFSNKATTIPKTTSDSAKDNSLSQF